MRKNIFVFMILGTCVSLPAFADYTIGNFVAPKGADGINGTNGTDCRPTETRTRCYGTGSSKCGDTTRSGVKIVTTQCDGSGSTTSYIYDNNCGITVDSVADVTDAATSKVTHKRVTFKNTCTNDILTTTADVPVGCTPTYTTKYINKETSGTYSYNNSSRSENTVGARTTVSGCGTDTTFDTYDGNDGTSFNYKGSVANCSALNSVSNPAQNDAYIVNGDGNGKLCIYNGSSWPTCPSGCAEFTGPAGDNNCTGYEDSNTAVKHTLRTYSGPSGSTENGGVTIYATRGKMVLTHEMCNTSLTVDNENDPCVPIVAPSGVTCNGTYFECKPQGTYAGNTNYAKYNVCEATTGTTFSSALSNKEDAVCVGTNANSSSVERKKTVSYTAPTGSGTVKTGVGKVVNKSVKCDNSETTISSTPDKCEEIAKPNGVCTASGKVYYKCTQQNNGTEYNLCADGNSVLSAAQSVAETAVAAVDPCAGNNTNSSTIIKTTSTTAYSRGTKTGNLYPNIGSKTVTKTACDGTTTYTTTEQDSCVEIAKPSNVCTAETSAYLRCTTSSVTTDTTYYVCQSLGNGNNSLSNKISAAQSAAEAAQTTANGKIDANYLTANNYLTTSSLGTAVSDAINTEVESGAEGAFKDFVTNDTLNDAISEKAVTFGGAQMTLGEVVDLLSSAVGNCSRSSGGLGANVDSISCTGGSLDVSTQGKNPNN